MPPLGDVNVTRLECITKVDYCSSTWPNVRYTTRSALGIKADTQHAESRFHHKLCAPLVR